MIESMNIAWWVQRWSELHPRKPAIFYEGKEISYLELHRRVNCTAGWLHSKGINKGDRVAVMLRNCPEFIELYLGCARIGAIFVPINSRSVTAELDYFLTNSRPKLFLFSGEYAKEVGRIDQNKTMPSILLSSLGSCPDFINAIDYHSEILAFNGKIPSSTNTLIPGDPESDPQVIMYTSGTTGRPKGAVLTHRKTFFNCLNAEIFFQFQFDDIMLIVLPLFHSGGLFIQLAPTIYKGATAVLHSKFDPNKIYHDIDHYRVTKFLGVPTVYKSLLKVAPENKGKMSSLKVSACGGEKMPAGLFEECQKAGLPFRQVMGQTETSILLWASEEDLQSKPGTVGRPVFHAEVKIADETGRTLLPGEIGEIAVSGSIMMKEYWQDPIRTEKTIKNGLLYTGDSGFIDDEGYFYLVDRTKDMYISGGENVYPAEIERVLREHPEIKDVAVVGIPDIIWGEKGHAFVVLKSGSVGIKKEDVIHFCESRLAKFKWPKSVSFVDNFPLTTLGKVFKRKLKENYLKNGQSIA
jgi:fatty-acyl-CoA synthase